MSKYSQAASARSGPARRVERLLDLMMVSYEPEMPFHPYHIDIYLTEWHIGVEIDGPFHNKTADKRRDAELLERYGLPILRLDMAKSYMTQPEIMDAILTALDEHCPSTDDRKAIWQTTR